jgi:MFS family permease
MNTATPSRTTERVDALRITLLWFGVQLAWGAVLGLSLQARITQLGGSNALADYGIISTAGALFAAVVQIVVGPFSDRRRRAGDKRTAFYVAGSAGAALALLAFYASPTIGLLAISFVALQAAMNVVIGPYQAVLPDVVPSSRIGVASGWMAAMQSAGNAAGAILATVLGNTPVLGAVIAILLLASCGLTVAHLRAVPLQPIAEHTPLRVTRALVDLFVSRALVYIGFYTLLGYFYFYVASVLPPGSPLNATTAGGIAILLFTLVGAAGAALAARPADRLDERLVVSAGGALMVIALCALAAVHVPFIMPGLIAVAGVGWGVFLCADWAFACRILPTGALATTFAIWNVAVVGPQMVAPVITTLVLSATRTLQTPAGPRVAMLVAAVEIVAGAAWIWRLSKQSQGK